MALTAQRLCIYIGWLMLIAIQTTIYIGLALAVFGLLPIACFTIGGLTYPIFAEQDTVLAWTADIGNAVETAVNLFQDIVKDLLDCKEALVDLWNTWVTLILGVIARVYGAVKDLVAPSLPDIFTWTRQAYRAERELRELEIEENLREMMDQFEVRMREDLPRIHPSMRQDYLHMMRGYLANMARAKAGVHTNTRITILPTELCDVITGVFDFFIGFLDIFGDFFLALLDAILLVFDQLSGSFSESFIFVLVQLLIVDILQAIPFTKCFIDPDSLESSDPLDILNAFREQVAQRLIACLCAFRYQNPGIMDPFLSPLPDGDPVPSNIGVAIAGCLCFNPTISLATTTDPIDLMIKCLGIDVLISAFQNFISILQNTFVPLFNNLQNAFSSLEGIYYALESAFSDLLDFANYLDDLFRRRRRRSAPEAAADAEEFVTEGDRIRAKANAHAEKRRSWAQELARLVNATEFRNRIIDEFQAQMTNQTYVDLQMKRPEHQALMNLMRPATLTAGALLNQMRLNGQRIHQNLTSPETKDRARGVIARLIEKLPSDARFTKWYNGFAERYGNDTIPHVRTIHTALSSLAVLAASHMRIDYHPFELEQRLNDVDFTGMVRAVFALSPIVRARRGPSEQHPALRRMEAAAKFWMGAQLGRESLSRVANALIEKYGTSDNETRAGVMFVASAMRDHEDVADIMQRFNVTAADLDAIGKTARVRKTELKAENDARASTLFLLQTHVNEEWLAFCDDVAGAYSETHDASPGKRVVAVAIAVGIGGVTSAVSIAGFAVGVGLTVGGTLLVGLLAPLLAIVVAFFPFLLNIVLHIGIGVAINTIPKTPDRPNAWDGGITAYIKAATTLIIQSYFFGWNLGDLQNLMETWSDITVDSLQYMAGYTFHYLSGKFPLPLGQYIQAPIPPVDENGRLAVGLDTYFLNMVILCPHLEPCLDDGPLGIECVCPGTPSRVGTRTPPAPCTSPGYRRCYPYIRKNVNFEPVDVEFDLDGECDDLDGFSFADARPWNNPIFDENGYNYKWFLSAEFLGLLWTIMLAARRRAQFITRFLVKGFAIEWTGAFIPILGAIWIIPALPLQIIALATIYSNAILGPVREAALWLIETMDANQDLFLLGPVATEILLWVRFDNYNTVPPLGEATARDWVCEGTGLPPLLIGLGLSLVTVAAASAMILNLSWLWAIGVLIDFVLLPVNIVIFTIHVLIINSAMYRNRVFLARNGPVALATIGLALDEDGERRKPKSQRKAVFRRTVGAHIIGKNPDFEGVQTRSRFPEMHHDCQPVYPLGSDLMFYRRHHEMTLPHTVSRPEWKIQGDGMKHEIVSALHALHSTVMALPTIMTRGLGDMMEHGYLSARRAAAWAVAPVQSNSVTEDAHHWVVLDKHVPETQRDSLPFEQYVFGPDGRNVLDFESIVIADPNAYHMRYPFEELAVYETHDGVLV
ncbi:MAG: hypothetical protein AB7P49_03195 [Bdellovibrionales bacterium]